MRTLAICVVLLGAVASVARATTFADVTGSNPIAGTQNYPNTLGSDFDVSAPLGVKVTHIGVFDDNQDGLNLPITVAIWDRAGTLVTPQYTLTGTNETLIGEYRFLDIPDVVLPQGFLGSVVAYGYGDTERNGNGNTGGPPIVFDLGGGALSITGTGTKRCCSGGGSFPTGIDGGTPYAAGNFMFNVVPEPSSIVLFGFGAIGLFAVARRRRV